MHRRGVAGYGQRGAKNTDRVKTGSDMAQYRLENILTQEIPDGLLMDIAYHWQANDNCLLDPQSAGIRYRDQATDWNVPVGASGFKSPPH
jgi:hypothetical protein